MISFTPLVRKSGRHKDGSYTVYIRYIYRRVPYYIATSMRAGRADLTPSLRIRNSFLLRRCDELVAEYRRRAYGLELETRDVPPARLRAALMAREGRDEAVSFTAWAERWLARATIRDKRNYRVALNKFTAYLGKREVMMEDVTNKSVEGFIRSLQKEGLRRAVTMYPIALRRVFNDARDYYNDEDNGIVRIRHSLSKVRIPKVVRETEKLALPADIIAKIFSLPYDNKDVRGQSSLHDLALDCFRLSFALMGMNSADLFDCPPIVDNVLTYHRQKTRDRRADGAKCVVNVDERVRWLAEKYKGETTAFNFRWRFRDYKTFNSNVNRGLKLVARELGLPTLTFYSARHSVATIAVNDCGVDKWTVNEMLCHTDSALRVTDIYIRRDFTRVNEAMRLVLDLVLGKKAGGPPARQPAR